jgi:hypothetical protein
MDRLSRFVLREANRASTEGNEGNEEPEPRLRLRLAISQRLFQVIPFPVGQPNARPLVYAGPLWRALRLPFRRSGQPEFLAVTKH